MDGHLTFTSSEGCKLTLDAINTFHRSRAVQAGMIVDASGIIGLRDGVSAPDSARTTTWDEPHEVDGIFYIAKPDDETLDYLTSNGFVLMFGDMPITQEFT